MASTSSGSLIDSILGDPCEDCLTILQGSQEEQNDPQCTVTVMTELLAGDIQHPWTGFTPTLLLILDDDTRLPPGIILPPTHGPPRGC
ncbi:MAG: hypothetical protein GY899_05485 [Verrucomicrobiaceae bacterium]|nr:hypothetical protein [Verrucomicrobiaceae bacterium]